MLASHLAEYGGFIKTASIDAVIGLAPNLFYSTGIPVSLIILKKDKTDRSVYFIDASEEFEKKGNKNELTEDNIQKIFKALRSREDIDKFAHLAEFDEIEENGFNLNIPRYVDTFEEEEPIDLAEVSKDIKAINEESDKLKAEILADMRNLVANRRIKYFLGLWSDTPKTHRGGSYSCVIGCRWSC